MNIEKTIEENMGLVNKMASNLYRKNSIYCVEDLIQVGVVNLLTSLNNYNSERSQLSTFICHCVKNSMIKFIKKNHDENKIHQSRFDSLPLSGSGDQRRKSTFFNSSFISGNSYYNPDIKIDEYIGDSDTLTHEVVKLKSKGKSNAEISRQVGVSSTKVKKMLNKIEASIKGYDE